MKKFLCGLVLALAASLYNCKEEIKTFDPPSNPQTQSQPYRGASSKKERKIYLELSVYPTKEGMPRWDYSLDCEGSGISGSGKMNIDAVLGDLQHYFKNWRDCQPSSQYSPATLTVTINRKELRTLTRETPLKELRKKVCQASGFAEDRMVLP